jgi:HEAT repeat protein
VVREDGVTEKDNKRRKVEFFESCLGYIDLSDPNDPESEPKSSLLAALYLWGELVDDAEMAARACLRYVGSGDTRVRSGAISSIGKLVRRLDLARPDAIAAVSRALSDADSQVRQSAEEAALRVQQETGIIIQGDHPS